MSVREFTVPCQLDAAVLLLVVLILENLSRVQPKF